jgi:outer membrane protein assembly factor BamB
MLAQFEGAVVDMCAIPTPEGAQLAVATGNSIHLLMADGQTTRTLKTDDKIRVLRWWDDPALLLAGCVDEQVIAFDSGGQPRWSFTSEMDPAVYKAAKTYWFKSAPGHEGIHGLHTGVFDDGHNRCFVGSACTLEILDQTGSLVQRTPVFWGPGRMFEIVAGPGGSKNLLISRWPNGNDHLAIVNSKTLAVAGRGYSGVPPGHTYVGGWTAQNRTGLFCTDPDGDGRKEVVTGVNGTWNRVSIYAEGGKPMYNAQFGPGPGNAPRSRMRDMDIADLNGDGRKEIVLALSEGLVVALSAKCQRRWSTGLSAAPVTLRCVDPPGAKRPWVVVGCEDGTVTALDGQGRIVRVGNVTGQPRHMQSVETPAGPVVVLATDQGQVKAYRIGN